MKDAKTYERGVVSYPKCGRTWIRLFFDYYIRLDSPASTHLLIVFRHNDEPKIKKRILLIRHPCDVMVSLFLHRQYRKRGSKNLSKTIRSHKVGIPWFNEMYAVWSQREENQIVIRYEDLFENYAWMKIFKFWNIHFDADAFENAREKTKFENIRNNFDEIKTFPSAWRYLAREHGKNRVTNPKHNDHHKFRRGIVGGYVDYMSEEDISYVRDNFTFGESLEKYAQEYKEMIDER